MTTPEARQVRTEQQLATLIETVKQLSDDMHDLLTNGPITQLRVDAGQLGTRVVHIEASCAAHKASAAADIVETRATLKTLSNKVNTVGGTIAVLVGLVLWLVTHSG